MITEALGTAAIMRFLARALHASVEVDDEIPVEHYHAVAEVIGYVMRLRRRAAAFG